MVYSENPAVLQMKYLEASERFILIGKIGFFIPLFKEKLLYYEGHWGNFGKPDKHYR